jgi:transcriptional regulator with XRE-family HTH domain
MVKIPVNGDVLKWARIEGGLSEEKAAKEIGLSAAEIGALESGKKLPTFGLLEKIAKKYQFPIAALLMPDPLAESVRRKSGCYAN